MHTVPPTASARAIGKALQHTRRQLSHHIGQLAAQPDASFAAGWRALVAAAEAAFRHEECVMELMAYQGLAAHREENARTLSALHHVTPRIDGGDTGIGRDVLDALAALVSSHRYRVRVAAAGPHLRDNKAAPGHS